MNNNSETDKMLRALSPIALKELENFKLMDRLDTKYVFSAGKIPEIINLMNGSYRSLEINNIRSHQYETNYFDTSELFFYNQHVTGRPERMKVRFRTYKITDTTFLEVKKHTRKNRTVKWRIENQLPGTGDLDAVADSFLESFIPERINDLKFSVANSFRRITLAGLDENERITIDYDLKFSDQKGKTVIMPWLAIIEHKKSKSSSGSKLAGILKSQLIRPAGFSKYCIGVSLLNENARKNGLKEKHLLIDKIEIEYNRCSYE